jgi:hypothetical protein
LKGLHLVYCPPINSRFRTGDLHPTSSRPCRAYIGIGARLPGTPPTPPSMRVRTRRFASSQ